MYSTRVYPQRGQMQCRKNLITTPHARTWRRGLNPPASANSHPGKTRIMTSSLLMHPQKLRVKKTRIRIQWILEPLPNPGTNQKLEKPSLARCAGVSLYSRTLLTPPPEPLARKKTAPPKAEDKAHGLPRTNLPEERKRATLPFSGKPSRDPTSKNFRTIPKRKGPSKQMSTRGRWIPKKKEKLI